MPERAENIGIKLTHVYGLTEVYGPASVCAEQPGWDDLPADIKIIVGGRASASYDEAIKRIGAIRSGSMGDFCDQLNGLRTLAKRKPISS